MIDGILCLDFSLFRKVPFASCELVLTSGDCICVEKVIDSGFLKVTFNGSLSAMLHNENPGPASEEDDVAVVQLREAANSVFSKVDYHVLDIHRSMFLRDGKDGNALPDGGRLSQSLTKMIRGKLVESRMKTSSFLSGKVKQFLVEAQIDYKKYFSSESPELFPKILKGLRDYKERKSSVDELIARLNIIKASETEMVRFGLTMNITDIDKLTGLLKSKDADYEDRAISAALEAYVVTLESQHFGRELIAARLRKFEDIVGDFFENKWIVVDCEHGLKILTSSGREISELQLSSGEYHMLFMLVTALVSSRDGTAIAIDEPELSLHVSWQRRLIGSLLQCSSGASPLFIFATHSPVVAAQCQDCWIELE